MLEIYDGPPGAGTTQAYNIHVQLYGFVIRNGRSHKCAGLYFHTPTSGQSNAKLEVANPNGIQRR